MSSTPSVVAKKSDLVKGIVIPIKTKDGKTVRRHINKSQMRLVQGLLAGKSNRQSLRDAGYSEQTVIHKNATVIRSPVVQEILGTFYGKLTNAGMTEDFWADKIKAWANSKSEKIQQGAYDRWNKEREKTDDKKTHIKKSITLEEWLDE